MIPRRYARYYLENAPSLCWLVGLNALAMLVGVRFYVETMPSMSTFLWPLYLDSPAALFLATLSLVTLLSTLGRSLDEVPHNLALAYLHTLAFVWLVKYGLWTVLALNLGFWEYFPDLYDYWFIVLTHSAFVLEAYLIPHYGTTTRGALLLALALLLANDIFDYVLGNHPPLRYEPGLALVFGTLLLSVLSVWGASRAFERLDRSAVRR
ncbi:DUF1405 domain-containing protein [Halalkalicoccus jeotgali]|uniref:DUF1405 domain-containing protein n=1 Tax=Halalkalicoccus jeotgali (strain DSM 18796 / CECT 7217 / JCM 14584 / KCTC 4019 / B3) TaxID=795797 RepID=D8JAF2_HALJB|nr:DUF1405 domain-containing protein [Halalkalicoccus jeotgali]ADJ14674.1 hypothetical protein HacjB3_06415 [Halalkalicoccus jeotgali B3]ELY39572.1 hypothetical protein C497_04812 [Halalkalicoccus jeotgali B3]